ncbi:hypothetical protein [Phenylobacterium sp.]|uniref:hypothetical protein n=1 Tax=Phenylobacterium sp. TaxID=1871053 RepID=UPI0025D9CED1|nr:hypothetical protein [Phenylobacterium sp.]MCA6343504.1 hypothetical protein [Phenylobacterium sp.]
MSRLPAGAWIRTAEGWRQIPGARPQVVFVPERRIDGPIDFTGWIQTGGRIVRPGRPLDLYQDGYEGPETLGDDE